LRGDYKGLLLKASVPGTWRQLPDGISTKGNCITHTNGGVKVSGSKIIYEAKSNKRPRFSGFIVENYSSYAKI